MHISTVCFCCMLVFCDGWFPMIHVYVIVSYMEKKWVSLECGETVKSLVMLWLLSEFVICFHLQPYSLFESYGLLRQLRGHYQVHLARILCIECCSFLMLLTDLCTFWIFGDSGCMEVYMISTGSFTSQFRAFSITILKPAFRART